MYSEEQFKNMSDKDILDKFNRIDCFYYEEQLLMLSELRNRNHITQEEKDKLYENIVMVLEERNKEYKKHNKNKEESNYDVYLMVFGLTLFPIVCLISIMGYNMMKTYYGIDGIYSNDIIMGITVSFILSIVLSIVFNNASIFFGYLIINLFLYIALIHPVEYIIDYTFSNKNIKEISSQVVGVYTGNMGRSHSRIYSYNARVRGEDENYYSIEINKENYNKFDNNLYLEKNKIDFKVKLYVSRGLFGHAILRKYSIE